MKRFSITLVILLLLPGVAYAAGAIKAKDAAGDSWAVGCEKTGDGRCLTNEADMSIQIDSCDSATGWAVLGNDASGLTTDLDHVEGSASLEYDAVDGAAGQRIKGIARSITSVDLTDYVESGGFISYSLNVSSTANIEYCFIRLGTSASHLNEWRVNDEDIAAGWNALRFNVNAPATAGATGNGITWSAVLYVAVGCYHDTESDALADVRVDSIRATRGYNIAADVNATVSSGGSPTKVDLAEVAGATTNVNGGNKDTGTQTIAVADDDIVSDAATETAAAINASNQFDVNIAAQAATALVISATAAANTLANPMFVQISQDGTNAVAAAYPLAISATAAANTLANPMFVQISQDGTNAMGTSYPIVVSATTAANATANRIYVNGNIDQIGGNAINTNGGNSDTGTQTVAIADDDNVSTKLTGIDTDTNVIQGDTTSIQTSIELRNAKLDDDATAQCVAITASDVDYTLPTAGDWYCITTSGNTAFINCGSSPAVDHTVGNFSLVIPEGSTICKRLTGPDCGVIGVTATGFICFAHHNSAL